MTKDERILHILLHVKPEQRALDNNKVAIDYLYRKIPLFTVIGTGEIEQASDYLENLAEKKLNAIFEQVAPLVIAKDEVVEMLTEWFNEPVKVAWEVSEQVTYRVEVLENKPHVRNKVHKITVGLEEKIPQKGFLEEALQLIHEELWKHIAS